MSVKVDTRDKVESQADFSGGLNDDVSPINIADNQVSDVLNMDFDDTGSITKRLGFTAYNSTALPGTPISGNAFDRSNGNRWFALQINETAKDTGSSTEEGSVIWYTTGNGTFTPAAWFDSGTATFAASTTVTVAPAGVTNVAQNLATATQFWIRATTGTDTSWYTIASVSGNTVTLDRSFTGTTGAGISYEIVQFFVSGIECYYEQYKDNLLIFQSAARPQRFDGTNVHFLENVPSSTDPTFTDGGTGNTDSGNHHIIVVVDYGTWGKSIASTGQVVAVSTTGSGRTLDVTAGDSDIPVAPQGAVNIEIYSTLTLPSPTSSDPHYFVSEVTNGTVSQDDIFDVSNTTLFEQELFGFDLGTIDQGWTAPVNGSIAKIMSERLFLIDSSNNPSLISISQAFFPGVHPTANTIDISTEDGQIINGLTENFGKLIILKDLLNQYYLTINSPLGGVQKIPTDLGCRSHKSIVPWRQWFVYMSSRGVALGTIRGSRLISRNITNSITGLKQALQRSGYHFATTQSELNTGATLTNAQVNSDGDIEIINDTTTVLDTSEGDFNLGTHTNTEAGVEPFDGSVQAGVTIEAETVVNRRFKMRNQSQLIANGGSQIGVSVSNFTPNDATTGNGTDGSFATSYVSDAQVVSGFSDGYFQLIFSAGSLSRQICRVNAHVALNSLFAFSPTSIKIRTQVRISGLWTDTSSLPGFESISVNHAAGSVSGDGGTVTYSFSNGSGSGILEMFSNFAPVTVTGIRIFFDTIDTALPAITQFVMKVFELRCYEPGFKLAAISGSGNSKTSGSIFLSQEFDLANANVSIGQVDVGAETLFYGDNDTYPSANDYGGNVNDLDTGKGSAAANLAGGSASFDIQVRSSSTTPIPVATAWVDQSPAAIFADDFDRYIQYRILFGNGGSTSAAGFVLQPRPSAAKLIQDVNINFFPRGTYESATIDITETPTRWGRIIFDTTLNGGTVTCKLEARVADNWSSDFSGVTFKSGDIITNSGNSALNRFVRVQFVLNGASTANASVNLSPLVSSFRIEWFTASALTSALPMAAGIHDDRYYLSGERPQATTNDRVYMCDLRSIEKGNPAPPWTVYDWALNGFIVSNNVFQGFPSNGTTVFNLIDGYNDNGTRIQAFVFTKPMLNGPGIKIFKKTFIEADRAEGSTNNFISYIPYGDFVGLVSKVNVDLSSELATDGAYSGEEISGDLSLPFPGGSLKFKTGPMGYTEGFGHKQVTVGFSQDARLSSRGHYIYFKIFNNALNDRVIKFHRIDVVYQQKNLRGASV